MALFDKFYYDKNCWCISTLPYGSSLVSEVYFGLLFQPSPDNPCAIDEVHSLGTS
jgi:hypothetical protein